MKDINFAPSDIAVALREEETAYYPTREMALDELLRMALYYMKDDRYEN